MAALRDFDRYVLPFVAGAPQPAIDDALIDSAREFCAKTYCIYEDLPAMRAPARPTVELGSSDPNLEPHAALEVYGPNGKLLALTKPRLRELWPDGWQDETVETAEKLVGWISLTESSIRLVPYLTQASTDRVLRITLSFKPTKAATTLPDLLYSRWPEEIAAGALARLHMHSNAPYADPKRAGMYERKFLSAIGVAGDQVEAGLNRPQLRTGLDEFV